MNRRKSNKVIMLKDDNGRWIEDRDQIKDFVTQFYQKLFSIGEHWNCWSQTNISYPIIPTEDLLKLGVTVSRDEVHTTVIDMNPWKAPGPDGFPTGFYQKLWGL